MNILALDTSGPSVSVALLADGRLVFESGLTHRRTHSQWLLPMIERALLETERTLADVDLFAAVTGPGSFTGVRLGVVTTRTLAQTMGKPCVAINALEALAVGGGDFAGAICPILDARAGQVYAAAFAPGLPPRRLLPDAALKLDEFLDHAAALDRPLLFTGDGVPVFRTAIAERLGESARFAPAHLCGLRAASVAALAAACAGQAMPYEQLLPYYLRAPQAERERAAKQQAEQEAQHG